MASSVTCGLANTVQICAELKQMSCVGRALCWVYRQMLTAWPLMQSLQLTCVNANLLTKKSYRHLHILFQHYL